VTISVQWLKINISFLGTFEGTMRHSLVNYQLSPQKSQAHIAVSEANNEILPTFAVVNLLHMTEKNTPL